MRAAVPSAAETIAPRRPGEAPRWYVGVDGGATRCRARVRDARGAVLAETQGEAANIHLDFESAVSVMRSVIGDALLTAGVGERDNLRVAVGLGLAGLNDEADAAKVAEAFAGYGRACAANDATTACIGAHAGADGGIVIAGTGSAAIARLAGAETIVGGRGFALGDAGSGAHIGLDALRAATLAFDGLGPRTGTDGRTPEPFRRRCRPAGPMVAVGETGGLRRLRAQRVPLRGKGRSRRARHRRVGRARVGALTRRVVALGASRVALVGGVGEALRPHLEREIAALLKRPLYDATDGAILMAGGAVATTEEAAQ